MELKSVAVVESPTAGDRLRLCAEVAYDREPDQTETYWFEVPDKYAGFLSSSGNPWLACLLPLAATLGEPLRLCRPVDAGLLSNVQELMRIWKCWYPHLTVVPIEAEVLVASEAPAASRTAAFFSGGVDSFFTVLRHDDRSAAKNGNPIDDLLSVWGFDVPLTNAEAFRHIRGVLREAAADLGKDFIDVATNLRDTRWRETNWGFLSHNCGLAGVGLALERGYASVFIASAGGYRDLLPWGSHVLTDPLLSTSRTRFIHDGAEFDRIEKTEFVAGSAVALRALRVCWKSTDGSNCCACNKCYRTMITLELFGALRRCGEFGSGRLNMDAVERIYSEFYYDVDCYRDIRALALRKGRADIARAIEQSLQTSMRVGRVLRILRSWQGNPLGRPWARRLEGAILARYLT